MNKNLYEGDLKDGKRHGKGKMIYNNGDVYEGDWKEGKRHGKGKMIYNEGDVYEGEWKKGKKHGKGKMTYNEGDVYEGDWKENNIHGKGKMTYNKRNFIRGSMYNGYWKKNKRDGKGKFFFRGNVFEGDWKNNLIHDKLKITYGDGSVYEGDGKTGGGETFRHGKGKMTYSNGAVYIGNWDLGEIGGIGKMTYSNGDVYIGQWAEDQRNGNGLFVFSNGVRIEGKWKNDINDKEAKIIKENTRNIIHSRVTMNESEQQQMLRRRLQQNVVVDPVLQKLGEIMTSFNNYNIEKKQKFTNMAMSIYSKSPSQIYTSFPTLNKKYIDVLISAKNTHASKLEIFINRLLEIYSLETQQDEIKRLNLEARGNKKPKIVKYRKSSDKYDESCPICGDEFKNNDNIALMHELDSKHQHVMCEECFSGMSSDKCPMCRKTISLSFGKIRTIKKVKYIKF
jgi:hypothetical protein